MRQTLYDFVNGIWSGIPICCILFFIRKRRAGIREIAWEVYAERIESHPLACYVQCDKCHARKKLVKIRHNGTILHWLFRS